MKRINFVVLVAALLGIFSVIGCGGSPASEEEANSSIPLSFSYETRAGATATFDLPDNVPIGTCSLYCRASGEWETLDVFGCMPGRNVHGVYTGTLKHESYQCNVVYSPGPTPGNGENALISKTASFTAKDSWLVVNSLGWSESHNSITVSYTAMANPAWGPNDKFEYAYAECEDGVNDHLPYGASSMGASGTIEVPVLHPERSHTCFVTSSFETVPGESLVVRTITGWYTLPSAP